MQSINNRIVLQSLLWAGRKINSSYNTTTTTYTSQTDVYNYNFSAQSVQFVSDTNCNNYKITNVANPVNNQDVVNKQYLDTLIANLKTANNLV